MSCSEGGSLAADYYENEKQAGKRLTFAARYVIIEVQKGGTENVSKNFEKWRRDH